ncbi:pectate lyase-like [Dorcoceras hygrometricum]|uniref:Pectate lyase n=1 Tax=Dorcoceras hygrometricum TaxID=472368 RepID=A0A2Z7DFQ2_9LAMI|nr:pectate lyase-like [Dorcoceras hygrometricum]
MALTNITFSTLVLLGFLLVVETIPRSSAKIANYDEYLQKRAEESFEASLKAFNPKPEEVTEDFNELVGAELLSQNGTRRNLRERGCRATNPIDQCWRCDRNWARNRKRLADCARGFGHRTTGGKMGRIYVVTDPSDDDMVNPKPGTLRHAVIQPEPLWIIFSHHMIIRLRQELIFTSHKTIDGRGAQVHIAYGAGLTLQFVQNVIIHNVWIHDIIPASGGMIRDAINHLGYRTRSDGDAISVYSSSNIWIDHVSLSKSTDGLIDVIEASTAITISNCKFNHHNDVMLLGAHDSDAKDAIMQVTVAFNRFGQGLIQRMPRCRWGFFHVVNNDYSHWELYAIGGSAHPTILSQGNRFKASNGRYIKEVTKRDYAPKSEWMKWQWRSEGDLFMNGAFFTESGPPIKYTRNPLTARNTIQFRPGTFVGRLTRFAGALKCNIGRPC